MTESKQTRGPDTAAELTRLAGWISEQLGDETADRQWIAESAAARVRDVTLQMLGAEALAQDDGTGMDTLRSALSDAIDYRDPSGFCADCDVSPAGLCESHAADLDKSDAYRALARTLGVEL